MCAGFRHKPVSNMACWPVGAPHARWTGDSFSEENAEWRDVSGNGFHGAVTRGAPQKVRRNQKPSALMKILPMFSFPLMC